jgi:hypothetical protein
LRRPQPRPFRREHGDRHHARQGTIGFSYDADQQRFMQNAAKGTTLYFSVFGVRAELFAGSQWNECLMVGGASPALLTIQPHFARHGGK